MAIIDPNLVPRRPRITQEVIKSAMFAGRPETEILELWRMYYEQDQPIRMPYRNGYVLIDPKDLCHQQFVPLH